MKKFLTFLLLSGVASAMHLGGVALTTEEAEDLYEQTRQHSNKVRGNSRTVVQIEVWFEEAKSLANGPEEVAVIDNAINIVRAIGSRRAEQNWVTKPTPTSIKQKFIDRAVAEAQSVNDEAQKNFDEVSTDPEAVQEEIDAAQATLTDAQTALTAAQAVTIADFQEHDIEN